MNSKEELEDLVKHTQGRGSNSAVEELLRAAEDLNHYILLTDMKEMTSEARYKAVYVGGWKPWCRYAVLAGNGTMHYFRGTKKQCLEVALRCKMSYRDGEFIAHKAVEALPLIDDESATALITALRELDTEERSPVQRTMVALCELTVSSAVRQLNKNYQDSL